MLLARHVEGHIEREGGGERAWSKLHLADVGANEGPARDVPSREFDLRGGQIDARDSVALRELAREYAAPTADVKDIAAGLGVGVRCRGRTSRRTNRP